MATATGSPYYEKRIMRELKEITENPPPLIKVETKSGSLLNWIGTIEGPPDTPYEGGKFKLSLHFPLGYPFKPPYVKFITPIYHANITPCGMICIDILKQKWSPAMNVRTLLLSICSLMADCNPSDSLRPEVAELYLNNRKEHDRRAREFTRKHAI